MSIVIPLLHNQNMEHFKLCDVHLYCLNSPMSQYVSGHAIYSGTDVDNKRSVAYQLIAMGTMFKALHSDRW